VIKDLYNRLPTSLRPLAKSIYLSISSASRISLNKRIGHAVSDDLVNWERDPENPVFTPADDNSIWDGITVEDPDIIYEEGDFLMFYAGHNEFQWETKQIGMARSETGRDWVRDSANPLLSPDPNGWHSRSVQNPAVVSHDDGYHMTFDGSDSKDGWVGIGYAQADVVDQWEYEPNNPIITLGKRGSWCEEHVADPSLVYHNGTFHIYYAGRRDNKWSIGHATTTDFRSIEQDPENPLISPDGELNKYKHINDPNVIHDGEQFHMIFAGSTSSAKQFGYASSEDGESWNLHNKPVLSPDESTGWEGVKLTNPGLVYDDEAYHLFYVGVTE
jgi:predicted GH43/DUF377 family glycosyl hydrolase